MRYIRPSWVNVHVDGRKGRIGAGPRARNGQLAATFLVRSNGTPLELLDVDFLPSGDGTTVNVRVTDKRTGAILFQETFTQ